MNAREYEIMFQVEDEHWWYVGIHHLIYSTVARLHNGQSPASWLMLDAGCGTGAVARDLRRFGRVTALDMSGLALQFCKRRGLNRWLRQASVTALPVAANSLDLVTSIDVLYMVPEDKRALAEFHRVLKPGGYLVLNLPALKWLKGQHDVAVGSIRRYTPEELQLKLTQCGFKVEKMSFANSLLFPLVAPYRLATNWFPAGESQPQSDLFLPPRPLNKILSWVMKLEAHLIPHVNLPIGMSLFVVASKGNQDVAILRNC